MTTSPTAPVRGWYLDPESATKWRFWDGSNWQDSTIDFPSRIGARDIILLAREALKTQWLYTPVAIIFVAFMAMDVAQLPLVPGGSVLGEIVVLGYPIWHVLLARSARYLASVYDIPVRPLMLWIPVIGPLFWWHIVSRIQGAPLWARLAPLWCSIGAFAAVVHEPVQRAAVGLAWLTGIMGSVVVVTGLRRTILVDTQSPLAP